MCKDLAELLEAYIHYCPSFFASLLRASCLFSSTRRFKSRERMLFSVFDPHPRCQTQPLAANLSCVYAVIFLERRADVQEHAGSCNENALPIRSRAYRRPIGRLSVRVQRSVTTFAEVHERNVDVCAVGKRLKKKLEKLLKRPSILFLIHTLVVCFLDLSPPFFAVSTHYARWPALTFKERFFPPPCSRSSLQRLRATTILFNH